MSARPQGDGPPDRQDGLLQRIANGERQAETEFVQRFQAGIRALVRRHARPLDPAIDDLVQDVLEAVLRAMRAGSVQTEEALPGYVRGTVVFIVQAHYRKRARRGEDHQQEPTALNEPVETNDPPANLHRERLGRAVRQLVAELPNDRDRQLLERFYLREQDPDEVCAALGIDPPHLRRVLWRARERLRALLTNSELEGTT